MLTIFAFRTPDHQPSSTTIRKALMICALALACAMQISCASKPEKVARGSEQDLLERAQSALTSSNWITAVQTLQLMEENYPFGVYADQAQLELIFAHFKSGEHEAAVASTERFIRLHPQHRNVDYAYYMRGMASFYNDSVYNAFFPTDVTRRDPGTAKDAFNYFSQLLNTFPNSPYNLDAKKRMAYLRNTIARSEINTANYYFKRGAYLAAANRGRWVVENFQGTPAVPDGLAVMVQAYHLLDMQALSDKAESVLALNFPNHPALKNGQFDYQFGRQQKRSWMDRLTLGFFDKRPSIKFDTRKLYDPLYAKRPSPNGAAKRPPTIN